MPGIRLNLLVLRSARPEQSVRFYTAFGLSFEREQHGYGPEHFSATLGSLILEIYPRRSVDDSTAATRLGFQVEALDPLLGRLREWDGALLSGPEDSPWGRRAVIKDPDGHRIELVEVGAMISLEAERQ